MWRKKKFIITAVVAVVVILGASIGGFALAADNGDGSQATTTISSVWDKMVTILKGDGVTVTADQLQSAYTGAQKEIQTEALKSRLDEMVTNGTITQDQEDAYLNWLSQRPDIGGGIGAFPGMGRMHGFDGFRGFGKLWPPATQTPPPTTQSN